MKGFSAYMVAAAVAVSGAAPAAALDKTGITRTVDRLESSPPSPETDLRLGRAFFILGIEDESFVEKGEKLFRTMKGGPDAIPAAYLAAFKCLRAKHGTLPTTKLSNVREGLKELDALVEKKPDDFEIRFLRASTAYYLPFFFGRKEDSKRDVALLSERYEGARDRLSPELATVAGNFLVDANEGNDAVRNRLKSLVR